MAAARKMTETKAGSVVGMAVLLFSRNGADSVLSAQGLVLLTEN